VAAGLLQADAVIAAALLALVLYLDPSLFEELQALHIGRDNASHETRRY
jgi:hypothetical protein